MRDHGGSSGAPLQLANTAENALIRSISVQYWNSL
eukprot:COSAG02_NODE_2465_length_8785_cov_21.743610_13_plen_35_part_00